MLPLTASLLIPDPAELWRAASYYGEFVAGARLDPGYRIEQNLAKFPPSRDLQGFFAQNAADAMHTAVRIERACLHMDSATHSICRDVMVLLHKPSSSVSVMQQRGILALRDRFVSHQEDLPALRQALRAQLAQVESLRKSLPRSPCGGGPYFVAERCALVLVGLMRLAEHPVYGPKMLGSLPPHRSPWRDLVRLVTFISCVGIATIAIAKTAPLLGAYVGLSAAR